MTSSDTRMCHQSTPALGGPATDGALTMRSGDLNNVSQVDIFNAPAPGFTSPTTTGSCAGDATVCASVGTRVLTHYQRLDFPLSTLCAAGIGAGASAFAGTTALAANAVYTFTDVTLNATAIANLANLPGSQIVICFSGQLTVPAGIALNSTSSPTNSLLSAPRAPSTLLLLSTSTATPTISLGAGSSSETSLSAVVYAPNASCTATGHVDVYGLLVCGSVTGHGGVDVHYDTELSHLSQAGFDRPVTVSGWREL
jgi:hypothetical protein